MTAKVFDTETSGMVLWKDPSEHPGQPRLVEYGGILLGDDDRPQAIMNFLIKPEGWEIPIEATNIHGVSTERALKYGIPIGQAVDLIWEFMELANEGFVCHNTSFDYKILKVAAHHANRPDFKKYLEQKPRFCTMLTSTDICKVPKATGRGFKWPTLTESIKFYFGEDLQNAHTALADAKACMRIFQELKKRGVVQFKVPEPKEA